MKNLYYAVAFFGLTQFLGLTDKANTLQLEYIESKESSILKDSFANKCAQTELHNKWLNENPAFRQIENQQEADRKIRLQNRPLSARRGGVPYEIPVVVHVIHDNGLENIPDAQIEKGIQFLNDGFSNSGLYSGTGGTDIEIQFKLAQRDPDGNVTTGINRIESTLTDMVTVQDLEVKNLSRWDPTCYVNIWLVREICAIFGCGVAGYAYLPSAHGSDVDGIVMESNLVGTNLNDAVVLNHEMGHYLGLYHTFEGGCKNDDCLVDGDRVCDTPPDQSTARVSCINGANSCSTDANPSDPNNPFTSDQNDQMENFMDYASCSVLFTEGQKVRMIDALENERFSLIKPDGCAALCDDPIAADFSASATEILAGETVTFTDNSIGAVTTTWTIDGIPFSGNDYTFNDIGTFNVQLSIIGSDPACTDKMNILIRVKCPVEADFTIPKIEIVTNELLSFTNISTAANTYEWTVNDMPVSSAADFDYSQTSAGIYRVCLSAKNAFCESKKCVRILVLDGGGTTGSGNEICTNGIDDDGDGLVDFFDDDCPCIPDPGCGEPFYSICTENCSTPAPATNFPAKVKVAPIDTDFSGFMGVADIDGDCQSDFVSLNQRDEIIFSDENIVKGIFGSPSLTFGAFALGDVDNDGMAEILATATPVGTGSYNIVRLDWNPAVGVLEQTWISPTMQRASGVPSPTSLFPYLADFNGDGRTEIYSGNQIFDPQTGIQLAFTFGNTGEAPPEGSILKSYNTAIAADLLPDDACATCTGLEIAAGNQIYAVDIQSYTDPSQNSISIVRELPGFRDGATAIADFDLDGDLDIIVTNREGVTEVGLVYVWDGQTTSLIGQPLDFPIPNPRAFRTRKISSGVPSVGDVDGDSRPEIVLHCSDILVLEDYQTGGGQNWGSNPSQTIRSTFSTEDHQNATTLFDFDLDGKCEIVTMGTFFGLSIFNENLDIIGGDSTTTSRTGWQAPAIVDYDDDGEAEIIIQANVNRNLINIKIHIFESDSNPWANARKLFTQHSHHNTHINDDGSIPKSPQNQILVDDVQLNSFNQVYALPNIEDCLDQEICTNGIDDDGDGLVDFFDDDCPCITNSNCSTPFYNNCAEACPQELTFSGNINKTKTGISVYKSNMLAAADIDGDCQTDIVLIETDDNFAIIDFETKSKKYEATGDFRNFTTGDIDLDGMAEIFIITKDQFSIFIERYDFEPITGNLVKTWRADTPIDQKPNSAGADDFTPLLADFNSDNRSEVFVGTQIFDTKTGTQLLNGSLNINRGEAKGGGDNSRSFGNKNGIVAVDILDANECPGCEHLELVAGNQIISVEINSYDNPLANSINVVRELTGFTDGVTAVADFDLDGDLDVIASDYQGGTDLNRTYVWDGQTPNLIGRPITSPSYDIVRVVAVPAVGDVDGDGKPEIIINSGYLTILEDYETGGATNWGNDRSQTIRASLFTEDHGTPVTLFDFDLDGKAEIIQRDMLGLTIYDENLSPLYEDNFFAPTGSDFPLVVDIDNDDEAELISYGCDSEPSDFSLRFTCAMLLIYESADFPWANTRKILNQQSNFNVNILDDGSVPITQQLHHLPQSVQLNSFNQQYAFSKNLSAEAVAKLETATCETNGIEIAFEICNEGEKTLPSTTPVAIYEGNPTQTNAPLLITFELPDNLSTGQCLLLKKTVSAVQDSIFVVVNDDGTLPRPFSLGAQFPPTTISECDYFDNISGIDVDFGTPELLDLGPDQTVCDNGVFPLDAGEFESYLWFDGSRERTVTVFEPGTYWVETTDICGNVQTDTIVIEIDPITQVRLGTDLTVCKGDTIQFDAGTFDQYKWLPKPAANCDTCQIFKLEIMQDTQVIVTVASDLGCFSTDTVDIFIGTPSVGFDSISICQGDTISINGIRIFSDTLLSQNINSINGCDSILNTKVIINDSIFIKEKIEICAGDTAFVFGNSITQNDTLLQVFNRTNGCDSTRQVEVKVKQALFESEELQFCEGDTAMIFGIVVTSNDTLSRNFTSSVGCDSTSEFRIVFTNSINTNEVLDLCAGDTAMIFGNAITSDTILLETYNSVAGCDSTHEVRVSFRPTLSGGEILTYCEGDTIFIFGNKVTTDATLSEILTGFNGCDSTVIIEVRFNKNSFSNNTFEYCAGDTARILGLEISRDTIISEALSNSIGCDSTHTIEITFNQTIETFEQLEFCVGDTAFVFGNAVTQDDTISQVFNSAIGCDSTHNVDIAFLAEAEKMISESLCENDILLFFNDTISETGTYFKTIPAINNGCDTNYVLTAEFFENPTFTLVTDTLISIGESFEIPLNISDTTAQVVWQSNPLLSCENCLNPIVTVNEGTTFQATITNSQGCSIVARINIRVADDNGVYIPSAFSPNNDGINDVFTIFSKEAKEIDQLQIFDRWGGLVYELNEFLGNDSSAGWDGMSRGMPVNSGVYVYKFLIKNKEGKQEVMSGDVTVVR